MNATSPTPARAAREKSYRYKSNCPLHTTDRCEYRDMYSLYMYMYMCMYDRQCVKTRT